uniref:Uncharacterized protein n=1 Tax=Babesia bovis TaxID=5865 RepID=S6CAM7_BABBO|nr:hypothetical protein [Babesia bovis]
MSSREDRDNRPMQPPIQPLLVSKLKTFWILNGVTFLSILIALSLVFIPFPGLRVNRGLERININLNNHTVPFLVDVNIKDDHQFGLAVYLSTKLSHHLIANIAVGSNVIPVTPLSQHRFLAAYYTKKPLTSPRVLNVFDFLSGAIIVGKYMQSDSNPGEYKKFDSSIYLIPHNSSRNTDIVVDLYELFHKDIDNVFQTSFVDSTGKIVHDVRVALGVHQITINIAGIPKIFVDPGDSFSLRLIELPGLQIAKVTLRALVSDKFVDNIYYIHNSNWKTVYIESNGLAELFSEHHIHVKANVDLFNINRITLPNRVEVSFQTDQDPPQGIFYHMAEVDGSNYHIIFGDWWYILGDVTLGGKTIPKDNSASDRVLVLYEDVNNVGKGKAVLYTKKDNIYTSKHVDLNKPLK